MLTLARFALGAGELAAVVISAWSGASTARARLVPAWQGVVTRIADAVLALAVITMVEQLLGTFGLLREWIVILTVVAVGVGLRHLLPGPTKHIRPAGTTEAERWRRVSGVGAVVAVAVTVGQWSDRIGSVLDNGITSFDSLHYHLPFAARFAQTGSTAHIQLVSPEFPDAYHHANAELLHALGMLLFHRDVLSVFVNLAFVALAIGAAYCIGERWNEGPLAVIGLCVLLASPLMGLHHAGTATNDVVVLAFVLCAAAMLVQPDGGVASGALVGLAAGMAFGTKLTAVAVAAALVLAVPFFVRRGSRAAALAWAAAGAGLPSAYWLLRDLIDTGNPAPGVHLPFFSSDSFHTLDDLGYSIAHYATSGAVWRDWFFPGLRIDLGRTWALAVVAVGAGVVSALSSHDGRTRALGIVAAAGLAFYVVTPTTALGPNGQPLLFASNVRYGAPALALALVLVPSHGAVHRSAWRWVVGAALFGTLVVSQFAGGPFPGWPRAHVDLGVVIAVLFLVVTAIAARWPGAAIGAAMVVAVLAAYPIARHYDDGRYVTDPAAAWASSVHHARIAIAGFEPQFELYGRDLSNHVQYVGARGPHGAFHEVPSCSAWRRALREGNYDFVVVSAQLRDAGTHEVVWTATDPAASPILTTSLRTVYRFDGRVADPGCPSVG